LLVAFTLALPLGGADASRRDGSEIRAYAQARAADSFGAARQAARGYASALALSPDNELLAARTLSQAMAAGDRPLALTAARALERTGQLAPDARLLLLGEALRTRDWTRAASHIDRLDKDQVFSFMTPILKAWLAFGSRRGDPMAILDAAATDPVAGSYALEHRPLMLLALGRKKEGVTQLLASTAAEGGRSSRLRIAGAALLARKGDRKRALSLLQGEAAPLVAARKLIEARKAVPGEVAGAPAGVAEFLVRVAIDLHRQNVTSLALTYARLATFLAPESSETWLVTSELLAAADQHDEALKVLANIPPGDPFAAGVADARIRLLIAGGKREAALTEAQQAVQGAGAGVSDWSRLGDLLSELERPKEAATAYGRAIALTRQGAQGQADWTLWLLHGGALHEAGDWPEAKAALETAHRLAPEQPVVLNYLGYAQLERRENLDEAEKLIKEASRLQPDDAAITDSLGWTYYVRGDVPKAIELLERAAKGQPADPAINEHLGDAYYTAGRRYEARYAWEAALLNAADDAAARLREKIETGLTPKLASP
jgi:Flp pilus assembly protein TadD